MLADQYLVHAAGCRTPPSVLCCSTIVRTAAIKQYLTCMVAWLQSLCSPLPLSYLMADDHTCMSSRSKFLGGCLNFQSLYLKGSSASRVCAGPVLGRLFPDSPRSSVRARHLKLSSLAYLCNITQFSGINRPRTRQTFRIQERRFESRDVDRQSSCSELTGSCYSFCRTSAGLLLHGDLEFEKQAHFQRMSSRHADAQAHPPSSRCIVHMQILRKSSP